MCKSFSVSKSLIVFARLNLKFFILPMQSRRQRVAATTIVPCFSHSLLMRSKNGCDRESRRVASNKSLCV